jgi:1-aminocyclopropane-1-carboxylate deaminase/D-cysteine desulfhydrase-like pyridoxal-dependent ACC family enzyme
MHKTIIIIIGLCVGQSVLARLSANPLFRHYPTLQDTLSYVALGDLPTPVHYCADLSAQYPSTRIFIKNDGVTGKLQPDGTRAFGGNKLRKLQYLLADALADGHKAVLTFGCVGSNHALQTTVCAQSVGLDSICMLLPQPNSRIVRRNLLLQNAYKGILIFSKTELERALATTEICEAYKKETGLLPYSIPTGGSTARGAIGYVEAAFELKEQIEAGVVPMPDHLYVTLGSGGTAAGLLLGCKAAGLELNFHLVLCAPEDLSVAWQDLETLFCATNDLLISLDPTFPRCEFTRDNCCIVDGYTGTEYGLFTSEGVEAMHLIKTTEGIELDGVYTGKCMSALLADLADTTLDDSTILFWNTFCAEAMTQKIAHVDYHELPKDFHVYFEESVQPLDC